MARFVLVHGAFGGAWCWEPVLGPLEDAGHTVETLDLPGGGDDQTPVEEVTLESCADRVCTVLAQRAEPAVLVGYSMGGAVITQAAANCPERVASMIFVCAFMPSDGQSLLDLTHLPEGKGDMIQANLVIEGDPPVAVLSAEATALAVYNRCTEEQAAWGVAHRRPQPVAPFAAPVRINEAVLASIPRSYVLTTHDQSIPPALQLRMIREHPCANVVELDADHAPFLSATDELVAALDELAALD
jgi:pimeloyl-ACP methyl ester carboxylesterase